MNEGKRVAIMKMSTHLLEQVLKESIGMPEDAVITGVQGKYDVLIHPSVTLLIQVEHPDLPLVLEGQQLLHIVPRITPSPDGPEWDWNIS